MKFREKIALALILFVSACLSITAMWWVWTGVFYLMEKFK